MNSEKGEIKARLMKDLEERLDKVLESPTVTFSDIENVVLEFQREMGREVAEGILALKKNQCRKNSGQHVLNAKWL